MHILTTSDLAFRRFTPFRVDHRFLCGAACHPGPGVTFLPGYNSAHVVLEDLGIKVARPGQAR